MKRLQNNAGTTPENPDTVFRKFTVLLQTVWVQEDSNFKIAAMGVPIIAKLVIIFGLEEDWPSQAFRGDTFISSRIQTPALEN